MGKTTKQRENENKYHMILEETIEKLFESLTRR